MSAQIQRRLLTNALITTLETLGKPVGDGVIPEHSGWNGAGPNAPSSSFIPYLVLTALTATPAPLTGSLAEPQGDWHMPYSVQSFGVTRDQGEWMADKARTAFDVLSKTVIALGDASYKFQQIWTASIGGNNRVAQTDPAYWGQQDQVVFWLAKR